VIVDVVFEVQNRRETDRFRYTGIEEYFLKILACTSMGCRNEETGEYLKSGKEAWLIAPFLQSLRCGYDACLVELMHRVSQRLQQLNLRGRHGLCPRGFSPLNGSHFTRCNNAIVLAADINKLQIYNRVVRSLALIIICWLIPRLNISRSKCLTLVVFKKVRKVL
jgi:hypothetical protein